MKPLLYVLLAGAGSIGVVYLLFEMRISAPPSTEIVVIDDQGTSLVIAERERAILEERRLAHTTGGNESDSEVDNRPRHDSHDGIAIESTSAFSELQTSETRSLTPIDPEHAPEPISEIPPNIEASHATEADTSMTSTGHMNENDEAAAALVEWISREDYHTNSEESESTSDHNSIDPVIAAEDNRRVAEIELQRGQTLSSILSAHSVPASEIAVVASALRRVHDPRTLRAGQIFSLVFDTSIESGESTFLELSFDIDDFRSIRIRREAEGFLAETVERELSLEKRALSVTVASSLYQDMRRAGIENAIVSETIRLLSQRLDLQREVRRNDTIDLVYDRHVSDTGATLAGALRMVRYRSGNGAVRLELYRFGSGRDRYFGPDGTSARQGLLRTPVDGARISSVFGMRRHPVLGYSRMHTGVDFAAPTGTPIYAAGDGRIVFIGPNGGYGNFILIEHSRQLRTAYAHLSRFARGLREGANVSQGDLIGYVGSTGLSTGPHLHYEVHVNGRPVDPMKHQSFDKTGLSGAELENFYEVADELRALIEQN